MSSPVQTTSSAPSREEILLASQRRLQSTTLSPEQEQELRFDQEREIRQRFRRLLDPGILRGVEKKTALSSIRTLLTIADNLLNEPDNERFRRFKPTNGLIKRTLVDVKGALEYAVEMGFRAEIEDFQPYYTFNQRKATELRVGASVLREALEREVEKEERETRAKQLAKGAADLQAKQVKLAFEDDRKRKALQDKLDRERRAAREAAATVQEEADLSSPSPEALGMPGETTLQGGRVL